MVKASELLELYLAVKKISTDTRKDCRESIFFALSGSNHDGNLFAAKALENGALWAIVDSDTAGVDSRFIRVENALKSLQSLANEYRNFLDIPVVAITGSNGKTTTKELAYRALSTKFRAHASSANFNNHIGLPISILAAPQHTEIMVLEMGDNRPGDIRLLCQIANPTHGLITNVGKDHLEGYGSMQANIATKAELFNYLLAHKGVCFFSSPDIERLAKSKGVRLNKFGLQPIEVKNKLGFILEGFQYQTQLIGNYNLANIEAAIGIAVYFGCTLRDAAVAVCTYQPENMRSQLIEKAQKSIILDAYNANPSSVLAALESFDQLKTHKPKIAIIGDMAELGATADKEHQLIADWFKDKNIHGLLVGNNFYACKLNPQIQWLKSKEELKVHPKVALTESFVLLKASRTMALETVLDWL